MNKQKSFSVIISYTTLILQILTSLIFTPFLIKSLGESQFGVYQIINSFAANLYLLNFGINQVVARNIIKYRYIEDRKGQENFLALSSFITIVLMTIVLIVGYLLNFVIDPLFKGGLTSDELSLAKYMYIYLVVNVAAMVWSNLFVGITIGYENQILVNSLKLLRQLLRVIIITVLILLGKDVVAIVATDLFLTMLMLGIEMYYAFFILKVRIRFHFFDKRLFYGTLTFSLASFLYSITSQINVSVDKIILGAMADTGIVTLYSISLLIFSTTLNISRVIGSVYLPDASKLVISNADNEKLTDLVIRPGRLQCMLVWMVFFGFVLIGKDFIVIWVGEKYIGAWFVAIILLLPTLISSVNTVANTIVDAKLKKMMRSLILLFSAAINVILSIILVNKIGYIGAAIATAVSMLIGNVILLNLYYKFGIKLNIFRMYKEIYRGIAVSAVLASILTLPVLYLVPDTLFGFIIKGLFFVLIYLLLLVKYGMNDNERNKFKSLVTRIIPIKLT